MFQTGDYPLVTWRLLRLGPADGATHMARDEAILKAVAAGSVQPTLCLYAWEPACLSLGRAQPLSDVDLQALQAAGFDLVRRPTGGKAILHVDELTYSVIAPQAAPHVAGGIVESYRRLSAGLVRGLERLGVVGLVADRRVKNRRLEGACPEPVEARHPEPVEGSRSEPVEGPVCFEVPADYEITVGGRKLVGSAQMRAEGVVLQHGALPLYGDITRICPLLATHPAPARVRARATTVEEALGRPVTWDEAAAALAAGFAEALNLHLAPGTLTDEEQTWTEALRATKYATDAWTRHI